MRWKLTVLDIEHLKQLARDRPKSPNGNLKNTTMRAIKILQILERDGFKCVRCGRNYDLTIDHENGRKFARHDNHQKYKLEECRTLCELCHTERNLAEYAGIDFKCPSIKNLCHEQVNNKKITKNESFKKGNYP